MQSNTHFYHWLINRGITDEVLTTFNIDVYSHPVIGDCIRIPYSEHHSKYRRDPNSSIKPKYLYDQGGKVTLYGMKYITPDLVDKRVVITEGELDTLVLWSNNIPAITSTGGAMSWQDEWSEQLKGYQVYLCFDNDESGAKGMVKVLKTLPHASVILLPMMADGKDISDYISRGGDFRKLMLSALHDISTTTIEEDMARRQGLALPTTFHQAYLDEYQQSLRRESYEPTKYTGDDKVLRAKSVPMSNYIEFRQKKACCPWHSDSTPSLAYYPKTNTAYCFGACGRAYDAIDSHMMKHNCTFKEAINDMNV